MSGLNKVMLIGRLGKDPEVRYMPNGKAVANFSMATSETWRDKQTGDRQEKTEWHNVVMFDKLAEIAGEYLRKGGQCFIEGKLTTRKWQDKEGRDRWTTEIIGSSMQMLGSRPDSTGRDANNHEGQGRASRPAQQQSRPEPTDTGSFEDDIPF